MASQRAFNIRPFEPDSDQASVVKLWAAASGFDGGVSARTPTQLQALLNSEPERHGKAWHVAVAGNQAVVGVLEVSFIGTKRTQVHLTVNPAWRRSGVGKALLKRVPIGKRLLVESRASIGAAAALLEHAGFSERKRFVRMRRQVVRFDIDPLPAWANIEEDVALDASRLRRALLVVFGEDAESDLGILEARLLRAGTRVIYLRTPKGDEGVCVASASDRCRKHEMDRNGVATIGRLDDVGLSRACRGKGLSRKLLHCGLNALGEEGFREFEVTVEKKRQAAVDLYLKDGFEVVDEDIFWIRHDDKLEE